jgi:hypothetical protein
LYEHGDVRLVQHVRHGTAGTTAIVAGLPLTLFTLANDGSDRPFVLAGLIVLPGIVLRIEDALRAGRHPARRAPTVKRWTPSRDCRDNQRRPSTQRTTFGTTNARPPKAGRYAA